MKIDVHFVLSRDDLLGVLINELHHREQQAVSVSLAELEALNEEQLRCIVTKNLHRYGLSKMGGDSYPQDIVDRLSVLATRINDDWSFG